MGAFDKAGPFDKFNSSDSQLIPAGQKGRKREERVAGGRQNISRVFQEGLISQTREAKDDGPGRGIDDDHGQRQTRDGDERTRREGGGRFFRALPSRLLSRCRIEKRRYASVLPHDG